MDTIRIRVNDYYGTPAYYSVMPEQIFDALELASLKEEEFCTVNKAQFDKMVKDYQNKMEQCPD